MNSKPFWWPDPASVISLTIITIFAVAYFEHYDAEMNGALIAAFAGAWGYFLGSSAGAKRANERLADKLDASPPETKP